MHPMHPVLASNRYLPFTSKLMAATANAVVDSLVEMGFPKDKAEEAGKATGYAGVPLAMEWILAQGSPTAAAEVEDKEEKLPQSLKCEDCGKLLRSELEAQTHAARTSHKNFVESTAEIKPLSAEDKAAQLAKLEEKIKQKSAARDDKEKQDALDREKSRRKTGKELTAIKQKMELTEAKKIVEDRRREKMEDRMARQRVKDQIARDRAEKDTQVSGKVQSSPLQHEANTRSISSKKHSTCRLQVRFMDGTTMIESFEATDTFYKVLTRTGLSTHVLMTTFPKKIFTDDDGPKTLEELGLVPSAVLIQTSARFC